ncbi:MAG: hypothetical protein Q9215_004019 [Flavoplaca cf. flavocitrina]
MPMRDFVIMELVNAITDKPDWEFKVFDEAIIAKWKAEILDPNPSEAAPSSVPANKTPPSTLTDDGPSPSSGLEHSSSQRSVHHRTANVSPRMFDWIIAEVRYKAELFKHFNCIEALDGVWKSDSLISMELGKALEKAVRLLEEVPEIEKDWHPGSNGQVLDLVHPSIYPLLYGQSRILDSETYNVQDCTLWIGKGSILQLPEAVCGPEWSRYYQWLPTEFEIPWNSVYVRVKSYINNLHPRYHSDLYSIISQVVSKAIPLWDRALSRVIAPPMQPKVSDWSDSFQGYSRSEPEYEYPEQEEDEDDSEYDMRLNDGAYEDLRDVIEPEPGNFKTPAERMRDYKDLYGFDQHQRPKTEPCIDLRRDYSRLQIIFEWKAVEQIYGFKNGEPTIQNIGKVLTRESRLLCFPNVMQHKVSSFKLTDPSKSGHRKLLALFLVDPHIKIISTENVPPQQHAWWKENVEAAGVFQKLPSELAEMVLDGEGFPITLETAQQQRLELMEERKEFVLQSEDLLKEKTFNVSHG